LPEGLVVGVGAIHRAVVVDAVLERKHVPDLMDHDIAGALEEQLGPPGAQV
jgi:GTP cyclohydrolase I